MSRAVSFENTWSTFVRATFRGAFAVVASVAGLATMIGGEAPAHASGPPVLRVGGLVKRSSTQGNLTPDDRLRLQELGLSNPQSAAIILRKIPRSDGPRQLARLRSLVRAPEGFAPSGVCDEMHAQGESSVLCSGHVSGPLGNVAVRMPFAAKLTESGDGSLHLLLHNPQALEAKPLFSWSSVAAAEHVKVAYELFPDPDGWLVYVRVGVEMCAHDDSAKTISDAMLRLESWLTRELAKV